MVLLKNSKAQREKINPKYIFWNFFVSNRSYLCITYF